MIWQAQVNRLQDASGHGLTMPVSGPPAPSICPGQCRGERKCMITLFLVIAIFLLVPVILFFMLFAKSIMTLDSVTIAGIVALELYMTKKVHPAFCILAGIAAFFIIAAVYTSRIAFWILTVMSVINWGCIAGFTIDTLADPIWGTVVGLLVAAVTFGLHVHERSAHT